VVYGGARESGSRMLRSMSAVHLLTYKRVPANVTFSIEYLPVFYPTIHRTSFLQVVFQVCKTLSLTLREKRRLVVFGKRVLQHVLGAK